MHFLNFRISGANKSVNQIWGCVWVVVVVVLWNRRNRKIFKSGTIDHIEIFTMVQLKVWSLILPVDQNDGALPRQTWIDICAVFASVLRRDPPQEPAKEQNGAAAADRTPTPKSVTEPPNTKSNTQELSRNREPVLSQYTLELASVKKTI